MSGKVEAQQDKAARRRAQILEAAGGLFLTIGFEATTTLDIARAAGVSKRDLYAAFPTKDDILRALVASRVARVGVQHVFATPSSRPEVLATLRAFGIALNHFLTGAEAVGLYRIAIAGVERQPEVGRALLDKGLEATKQGLVDYANRAVQRGCLATMDVEAAVSCFLAIALGTLQMRVLLDPETVIDEQEIATKVDRAIAVFQSFEQKPVAPK